MGLLYKLSVFGMPIAKSYLIDQMLLLDIFQVGYHYKIQLADIQIESFDEILSSIIMQNYNQADGF